MIHNSNMKKLSMLGELVSLHALVPNVWHQPKTNLMAPSQLHHTSAWDSYYCYDPALQILLLV